VFPVKNRDGTIDSSFAISAVLQNLPLVHFDCVLVAPEVKAEADAWLKENHDRIITPKREESNE
jgi:hypothetical protein